MCVAVPMKLTSLNGHSGVAETDGVELSVNTMLLPDAKPGDYVIVHAGFAIQHLDVAEAERTLELIRELAEHEEDRADG